MQNFRPVNCKAKPQYLSEGTFTRVNREVITKNGQDYVISKKTTIEPKQLRMYPIYLARKYDLCEYFDISKDDIQYLKSLPVNDSMRVQRISDEYYKNQEVEVKPKKTSTSKKRSNKKKEDY